MFDVVVVKHAKRGVRQPAGLHQAGMTRAVGKDEAVAVNERRKKADVRRVAGPEGQGGFGLLESRQVVFQLRVGRHGPGNQREAPAPTPHVSMASPRRV